MSFDNFKLKKMSFSDNNKFKKKKPPFLINPEIAVSSKYSQKKMLLSVFLKVSLNTGNVPFFFEIESESKFSFKEKPDKDIVKQFSTMNCPAIIFPYIRETIADLTRRAGYPPLHLPPINFVELVKNKQVPQKIN